MQISEAISNGVATQWIVVENGDTTLNVGAGTVINAGVFPLERKALKAGDEAVTTGTGRALESVFAITPDGDVKASVLRQAAAMSNVAVKIDNAAHTIELAEAIMFVQMPADYDETSRKYKTPLKAKKA